MNVKFYSLDTKRDWPWVTRELGVLLCQDTKGIIAVDMDAQAPAAVCVLDSWTHTAVQCHLAVMRPMVLRHKFFEEVADYVFNACGRELLIGLVPGDNEKALKLNRHIGFVEKYRVEDGFDFGIDYVVMEMRKEDCRWLSKPKKEARHGR